MRGSSIKMMELDICKPAPDVLVFHLKGCSGFSAASRDCSGTVVKKTETSRTLEPRKGKSDDQD